MRNTRDSIPHQRLVAVIGLGYVGLPIALALSQVGPVIAFDVSEARIAALSNEQTSLSKETLTFSCNSELLYQADFYIVAVPTPVDSAHQPDLSYLIAASELLGEYLKPGNIVVYESTVYPGATEEVAVPILEKISRLKEGVGFYIGYSPERINPGDELHAFYNVTKVISANNAEITEIIKKVYGSVIKADIYIAPSIKVAEAAKVIENTQRDLNIALMNELAIIFNIMGIDTQDVLATAGTKWNFLKFEPGLVGGHCIGVDPYYLTYKAEKIGYRPEVILSGRRINDNMGKYIADKTIKHMIHAGCIIKGEKVAVLGLTFKENCADVRNSRAVDVVRELISYGVEVLAHDPIADFLQVKQTYGIILKNWEEIQDVSAIIVCVAHTYYKNIELIELVSKYKKEATKILSDVKAIFSRDLALTHGIQIWRL